MPESSPTNPGENPLDSAVGTLLQEALDAAGRVEKSAGSAARPAAPARSQPVPQGGTTVEPATSEPAGREVHAGEAYIGQLDEDLAKLTESLISSETVSPAGPDARRGVEVTGPAPGEPPKQTTPPAPVQASAEPAKPPTVETAPPAGVGAVAAAQVGGAPASRIEATSGSLTPAPDHREPAAARGAVASLGGVAARAAPIAITGLAAVSKPLEGKPRIVRDTVGWLALWTLFLGGCVWIYILFVHKPAPDGHGDAIHLVTSDRAPATAAEHGAEKPAADSSHEGAGGEGHAPARSGEGHH